jgi:hypothetical protein
VKGGCYGRRGEEAEFSVVYLHGFSGSHPTLAPAMDMVADGLEANLFCTRYAGHGRKELDGFGKAMGEASVQDWVGDTVEALAIGRKLGKEMVEIMKVTHSERHVLAGDLMSPESTDEVVNATLEFIREEVASGK